MTFDKNGVYFATLTVTDPVGANDSTTVDAVVVNLPPTANAAATCTGLTCNLVGTGSTDDGTITKVYRNASLTGNGVRLTTSDGTYFFYAHLDTIAEGINEGTVVKAGNVTIGGAQVVVMAGPCSVESYDQIERSADIVADAGATVIRGGAFTDSAEYIHVSFRHGERPTRRNLWTGFRLARSVD